MESCMNSNFHTFKLGNIAHITKLAGFEHSEYIQPNATKVKINETDVAMYLGLNIKNGKIVDDIHWYIPLPLSKKLERSALTKKCIILPYVGSVGDLAIYNNIKRHHLASNVAKIELLDEKSFSTEYLYYYLKSPYGQRQLLFYIQGGVQKNITMDAIRKTVVSVVPNSEAVVKLLATLDDKINLNNQINAELEAMAKLIYDYWFVQFDFPDENGNPYKSSGGKMVWSEELKREIPEGWEVRKIENLVTIQRGNLITEETANTSGDIKVVAAGLNYSYKHDESNFAENTITVSSSGANAGYINLWREPIYASDCIVLRGINDTMTFYIWGYLNLVKGHVLNQAHGSAQPHVYPSDLENLFWVEPSKKTLNQFSNIIIPLNKKIGVKLRENQKLVELRDWLLPMLMNGQVKLKP